MLQIGNGDNDFRAVETQTLVLAVDADAIFLADGKKNSFGEIEFCAVRHEGCILEIGGIAVAVHTCVFCPVHSIVAQRCIVSIAHGSEIPRGVSIGTQNAKQCND